MERHEDLKKEKKEDLLKNITVCRLTIEEEYQKLARFAENLSGYYGMHEIVAGETTAISKPIEEKLDLIFDLFQGFLTKIEFVFPDKSIAISINDENGFNIEEIKDTAVSAKKREGFADDKLNLFYKKVSESVNSEVTYIKFHIKFIDVVKKITSMFSPENDSWYSLISKNGRILILDSFEKSETDKKLTFSDQLNPDRIKNKSAEGIIEDYTLIKEKEEIPVLSVYSKLRLLNSEYILVFSSSEKTLFSNLNAYNLKMLAGTVFISLLMGYLFWRYTKILKLKSKQLFESEKKFREIFESSVDLYFRTDLEGKILMVSPSCLNLSGFKDTELIGKNVNDLYVNPENRKFMLKILKAVGYLNDYELKLYNKEGVPIVVSMTSKLIMDQDNEPILIEGTLRDISERKITDKIIIESKIKAESAVRAKNKFLTNLSHELKTPLNAIIGYSQLYKDDKKLNSKIRKVFNIIENSSDYLLTLLNDLLDISKNESGHLNIEKNPFDMYELLEGVVNIIKFRTEAKEIDFILDYAENLPRFVNGDAKRIRQILINLLGNASKFTDKGFIKLKLNYTDSVLKIVVSDSGIGIPADKLSEIFKPFYQVDYEENENEGTGLGLTITKMLVEAMDGEIEVKSVQDNGTIFTLSFEIETSADISGRKIESEEKKNSQLVELEKQKKDTKIGRPDFPVPDQETIAVLLGNIKNRNISAVNLLLDKLESDDLEKFVSLIRSKLNLFKIDYLVEFLSFLLETKDE